ncbi:MAG: tetratricopeptide repeat protein [Flavobacteriales bacterium]|jgi:tetratricopeptide (TPR) repeat protein|nr:tetratricopeptide repeat protein [Flavobacteriales bacterium]
MRLLLYVFAVVLCLAGCNDTKEQQGVSSNSQKMDSLKANNPMQELNERIKKAPNNSVLYFDRAGLHLSASSIEDAINDLDRAIKLDSTNSNFFLLKGDIFFMQKKTREAKALLDKSIELDGENIDAHLKLAEMYFYSDKYQESINSINNALRVDKFHAKAYFQKGMTYKYFGDTAKAVSSFQTAIEQNSDYYDAHLQLGVIYASINDPMAIAYYNNALQIKPTSIEAIYNKSLFLQENGQPEQAVKGYQLMTKIDPSNYQAYYNMGYIKLTVNHDLDSALIRFNQVIALNQVYYPAYYNIGLCHEQKGDLAKAKINYQATLKLKPDYDLAALGLSRVMN